MSHSKLDSIIQEYVQARAAGEAGKPADWIARYPEFATELRKYFNGPPTLDGPATPGTLAEMPTLASYPTPAAVPEGLRRFGDYEICEEIARGGMGVVFKARQISVKRTVALKMILAGQLASAAEVARFRTEAEAAANLDHPHILPIYEVGEHQGERYFSMKLIDGGSLAQRLKQGSMDPRAAARLMAEVARAVHFAHQHGILHRDLKPANILLDPADHSYVTDFGLAKRIEDRSQVTQSGALVGTPSYMAPEQARADKTLTTAADTYALGAILYELLAGQPPFQAATPLKTVMLVLDTDPERPSRLRPTVPRDLETICLKCLQKEPHKRYPSAEALADELTRFLEDRPIQARPVGRLERTWRWCRRNPVIAGLSAAAAAGVVVAAVLLYHERSQTLANLDRAESAERNLRTQLDLTEAAEREKTEQLWQSYVDQARAGRYSGRLGQRFDSLHALTLAARLARERHMPPERFDRLRHEAIACLALPDIRRREWEGWPEGSVGLDFNGPRRLYARTNIHGDVSVRGLEDDVERGHLAGEGVKLLPTFSPGGDILLLREIEGQHRLLVWRPGEERPFAVLPETPSVNRIAFAPDASRLAVGHSTGAVHLYELPSGRRQVLPGNTFVWLLRISPDGRRLVVNRQDGITQLYELPAARLIHQVRLGPIEDDRLEFDPTGRYLAFAPGHYPSLELRRVYLLDLSAPDRIISLDHSDRVQTLAWHPDGKLLAVGTIDASQLLLWDVSRRALAQTITSQRGGALVVQFNPTGDLLVSHSLWDKSTRVWQARTGKLLLTSAEAVIEPNARPTPGGGLLSVQIRGRNLRSWEACPSQEYRTLVPDPAHHIDLRWRQMAVHPGGRLLAAGLTNGVGLWDLETGNMVEFLDLDPLNVVLFDSQGTLVDHGGSGLRRWPVVADPASPTSLRIGPPQRYPVPPAAGLLNLSLSASKDGKVLACALGREQGVAVLHLERPDQASLLTRQYDVRSVAVSPDGRLIATGNHHADPQSPTSAIKIRDAASGRLLKALLIPAPAGAKFSPDGHWLAVSGNGISLWNVESWKRHLLLEGGAPSFSADGKVLALETGPGELQLIDPETGRSIVRLEDPYQAGARVTLFTPDGSRLIASSGDDQGMHVWDLRLIRARLADMGLDWQQEALPPPAGDVPTRALRVTLDRSPGEDPWESRRARMVAALFLNPFDADTRLGLGISLVEQGKLEAGHRQMMMALALRPDLPRARSLDALTALRKTGTLCLSLGRWQQAADAYAYVVKGEPIDSDLSLKGAALFLMAGDQAGYRRACAAMLDRFRDSDSPNDLERTVKACLIAGDALGNHEELALLAWRAVERGQTNSALNAFQFALALSEYREGHYPAALQWLERSSRLPRTVGPLATLDQLFLAMTLHHLSRTAEAERYLRSAQAAVAQAYRVGLLSPQVVSPWHDWIFCRVALEEAQKLLAHSPASSK